MSSSVSTTSSTVNIRMFIAIILLKYENPVLFFSDLYTIFLGEYISHLLQFFTYRDIFQAINTNLDGWFEVTTAVGAPAKGDENMPHVIISFNESRAVREQMLQRFQESFLKLENASRPGLLQKITEARDAIRRLLDAPNQEDVPSSSSS